MHPQQLQLFKKITLDYFSKLSSADEPVLEPPIYSSGSRLSSTTPAWSAYGASTRGASQAFSGNWEISVPQSLGPDELRDLRLLPSAFVMPIRWLGSTALLVVGLEPAGRNGQ